MVKKMLKEIIFWIAIIILIFFGVSILYDIIYLTFKVYPSTIIRFIIAFLFILIIMKYTLIGKEVNKRLMKGKKMRF